MMPLDLGDLALLCVMLSLTFYLNLLDCWGRPVGAFSSSFSLSQTEEISYRSPKIWCRMNVAYKKESSHALLRSSWAELHLKQ